MKGGPIRFFLAGWVSVAVISVLLRADEQLYRWDGTTAPYSDPGWITSRCTSACTDWIEDGHFVIEWPVNGGEDQTYFKLISNKEGEPPPPQSLWVEWGFRSSHPLPANFYTCDARFSIQYFSVSEQVFLFGNAVVSFGADFYRVGLEPDVTHTYRFESPDGVHFRFAVDGDVFWSGVDDSGYSHVYISLGGDGGCGAQYHPVRNYWDAVSYGTIAAGEKVVSSVPPSGFLDPGQFSNLDRFVVTFDSPNFVYKDDIAVTVTSGDAPEVLKTRRLENGDTKTLEVVLDRPIPVNATTRFALSDGAVTNTVRYTLAFGDSDGNGAIDLLDASLIQLCFAAGSQPDCTVFDINRNSEIELEDFSEFLKLMSGPSHQ